MRGRNGKTRNLYAAEQTLIEMGSAAHDLSVEIGVAADDIHFDDAEPQDLSGAIEAARSLAIKAERVVGLLRAYEMMRNPGGAV